jgi:methyl-galactoside transport system substrate-binding protein
MKRLIFVLAATALVFAACSPSSTARPRIGVAMRSFDDAVSVAVRRSIETAALDKADLAIIDGQNQQSAQNLQVDSFFERKLAALAVDPVEGDSVGPLIGKAKTKKTPIVFFDRKPSDEAMRSWDKLFFVGTRESDAGAAQGEIFASYWKAEPGADKNKDGAVQFIALDGDEGSPASALLAEGFAKTLGAQGIRAERLALENRALAARGGDAAGLIAKYGDKIEAVICADASSALQTIGASKAAGFFKAKKSLPIIGLGEGEPPSTVSEALAAGTLLGAAYNDSEGQGRAVFDLVFALAKGSDPGKTGWRITDAKYVWVPYKLYTRSGPLPSAKN